MYINGKMIPAETVPGMEEEAIKENSGMGEFKYEILIYCKKFCKCHNVPPPNTIKKRRK
jgi:hypothetical protein